jgi:hypothetical protein
MMEDEQLRWITAEHEAGHAVMRWLRGLPATDVHVNDGFGLCEGTEAYISGEDALLVTLAGPAVEAGYGLNKVNIEQLIFCDLDEARQILDKNPLLRIRIPENPVPGESIPVTFHEVEDALRVWFDRTCAAMFPHCLMVEDIACAAVDGYLSAVDLQTILDQYEQELENNG